MYIWKREDSFYKTFLPGVVTCNLYKPIISEVETLRQGDFKFEDSKDYIMSFLRINSREILDHMTVEFLTLFYFIYYTMYLPLSSLLTISYRFGGDSGLE